MPLTPANPPILPALPQNFVSPKPPDALGGSTITCNALDSLQTKLDSMAMTDTLVLEAGATWTNGASPSGTYELPMRTGTGWMALRSSAEASLPAAGVRIRPAQHGAFMPKIMTVNHSSALVARDAPDAGSPPCQGIRMVGLEICNDPTRPDSSNPQYHTLLLGHNENNRRAATVGAYPAVPIGSRYIVERCWVHGGGAPFQQKQMKGISFHGNDTRICDSWVNEYNGVEGSGDLAAIWTLTGQTALIENNYLSGSGVCFFTGGTYSDYRDVGATSIVIPSDIILRRNFMEKDPKLDWFNQTPEWQAFNPNILWSIKPCVEFKQGLRVLVEGNHCHNSFAWPAILFEPVDNQDLLLYGQRRQTVEDCTARYNLITDSMGGFMTWFATNPVRRVHVHDNLGLRLSADRSWGPGQNAANYKAGFAYNFTKGTSTGSDFLIEHNTLLTDRGGYSFESGVTATDCARFQSRFNIFGYGRDGHQLTGSPFTMTDAVWDTTVTDWGLNHDVFIHGRNFYVLGRLDGGGSGVSGPLNPPEAPDVYESSTYAPMIAAGELVMPGTPSVAGIGMGATQTDLAAETGILTAPSPLRFPANGASDSRDYGVAFTPLNALQAGVADGTGQESGDVTAPTVPVLNSPATGILSSSYTLTWPAATDAGTGVTGYDLEITDTVTTGVEVIALGNVLTYTVQNRTAARQYSNKVRAHDAVPNHSAYSTALLVTTTAGPVGTPAPPDLMRGFGATRGVNGLDAITTNVTAHAAQRTYAIWFRVDSFGGQGFGEIFSKGSAEYLYVDAALNTLSYQRKFSGSTTNVTWSIPMPALGTRKLLIVKYDSSSVANNPAMKLNDALQSVSPPSFAAPVGTVVNNTNPYVFGNFAGSYVWDGDLAKVAFYDFLTSDANDSALFTGTDPLTIGAGPSHYWECAGTANEPDAVTPFAPSVLTGTVVQNYAGAPTTTVALSITSGDPDVPGQAYQVTAATTGTVNRVEFFVDGALFRSDASAPYTLFASADRLTEGTHTVEARVFADAGLIPADTDTLVISTDTWRAVFGWDPFPGATAYNIYVDTVLEATIPAPAPGVQPQYEAFFAGATVEKTFGITPIVAGVEVTAALLTTKQRFQTQHITGFQELSREYTAGV